MAQGEEAASVVVRRNIPKLLNSAVAGHNARKPGASRPPRKV